MNQQILEILKLLVLSYHLTHFLWDILQLFL